MPTTLPQPIALPLTYEVLEETTPKYTATILDDAGNALPIASLTTITLTLYVIKADGTIAYVNSRNAQNVKNANNVTIDSAGLLTWSLAVADTTLVEDLPFERHIALWEYTWGSSRAGKHQVIVNVQRLGP